MHIVLTGANGFIGRVLAQRLLDLNPERVTLLDLAFERAPIDTRVRHVVGAMQDRATVETLLSAGCDVLIHLAAIPGGAAEQNPALSRSINLDAALALFESAAASGQRPRVVYASTIAVLGAPLPAHVGDDCPVAPAMTYGCHKAMVELALADLHRRGLVDAVSVRLPAIVARPPGPSGLKSAYMSNIFHALRAREPFVVPVSPTAMSWIMSVKQVAENLCHAATMDSSVLPVSRVVTLPALRISMQTLAEAICEATDAPPELVSYKADAELEAHFGAYPPLSTQRADSAGFVHDGDVATLVRQTLATL